MKANALIFIIGFALALGAGYLIWGMDGSDEQAETGTSAPTETENETEGTSDEGGEDEIAVEAEPLVQNNCLSCHAVDSLGASGGTTGPDLSNAYTTVEGKHGKPLEEFLKEPTSAVMSTVIEGNPLSDEEREQIVQALRIASEKNERDEKADEQE